VCAIICKYICAMPSLHKSGRKVSKRRPKPLGFTVPYYFYMYNISSDDSAAIQTTRAEIYLFTIGTPYKIDSRILVLASMGQGIFPSNVPARRHSGHVSIGITAILQGNTHLCMSVSLMLSN
jgi:hypothetical protein